MYYYFYYSVNLLHLVAGGSVWEETRVEMDSNMILLNNFNLGGGGGSHEILMFAFPSILYISKTILFAYIYIFLKICS